MPKVYLSLGTNIGDKRSNLTKAATLIAERVGNILALSAFYETEPWGFESENNFLNAALELETSLTPFELLNTTIRIELEMGRKEKTREAYNDRIIDIDILLYDDVVMNTPELTLPHPLMHKRIFVLQPLAEIAPEIYHPLLNKTIQDLLYLCTQN